ncbi:hypothetical protein ACFL1A_01455 [Patescibacteria group bacterium]
MIDDKVGSQKQVDSKVDDNSIVKDIDNTEIRKVENMKTKTIVTVYTVLILLGVATGYFLSNRITLPKAGKESKSDMIVSDTVVGSTDEKTFKDSAEGELKEGGLDGEGTHQLVRDGGPSQTVYLISSVVDLGEYIGKNVKVWGQTQAAQKAAWLMDVGKIELQK